MKVRKIIGAYFEPCPFCGCSEIKITKKSIVKESHKRRSRMTLETIVIYAQCALCGCTIKGLKSSELLRKWNKRS